MSSVTDAMIQELNENRRFCYQTIMDIISDYIYRERRYKVHFSIAIIYSKDALNAHANELRDTLRRTDKVICVTENIICVVFDSIESTNYVKAAENLYRVLESVEYHQHYFIATTFSQEFDENYLNMLNHLFDRLLYLVEHNQYNNVTDEDYFI